MKKLIAAAFFAALVLFPAYLHTTSVVVQAAATVMAGLIAVAYILDDYIVGE